MKLDKIRIATEEEVAKIAENSDLTPNSRVLAMGENLAVWRIANEIDPVYFAPDGSNSSKYMFIWGLENILRGSGATEFYFNVPVEDDKYRAIVEHFGATPTSVVPEMRYKIIL